MHQANEILARAKRLQQENHPSKAEELYRQVVKAQPELVEAWVQLGTLLQSQSRLKDAEQCYRRALSLRSDEVDVLTQLGICLARQRRHEEAISSWRKALQIRPNCAKAHNNMGVALAEIGRASDAMTCWQEAIRYQPDYAEAHFNVGNAKADKRHFAEAEASYRQALTHRPDYPEAFNNLGLTLIRMRRPAEAIVFLEQAVRLRPEYWEAHNNLGLANTDLGNLKEAVLSYQSALKLRPNDPELHTNLGSAYSALQQFEQAMASYQIAIWHRPEFAEAHWNRSLAWLQMGNFDQGWPEYEWRWRRGSTPMRQLPGPMWDGSDPAGKTVLLWCEQGIGDTIMFIRYAREMKRRGATVIVEGPPNLKELLSRTPGIDQWIDEGATLPRFDIHCPLMSLPRFLGVVPADEPYVIPDADLVATWKARLATIPGKKVGIAWQGNPNHRWDRFRSLRLEAFEPISKVPGIQIVSLQKGRGAEQLSEVGFSVLNWADEMDQYAAFVDSAALLSCLDLFIGCDSATLHLAGGVGIPAVCLLSAISDWRWGIRGSTTPWYPKTVLHRQQSFGDWNLANLDLAGL